MAKIVDTGEYKFEIFSSNSSRFTPFISVLKANRIGFSESFMTKHHLSNIKSVNLMYDSDKKAIGIEFLRTDEGGTVKFIDLPQGAYVNAKSFFGVNDIDSSVYAGRYYDVEKISVDNEGDKKDVFAFTLKDNREKKTSSV